MDLSHKLLTVRGLRQSQAPGGAPATQLLVLGGFWAGGCESGCSFGCHWLFGDKVAHHADISLAHAAARLLQPTRFPLGDGWSGSVLCAGPGFRGSRHPPPPSRSHTPHGNPSTPHPITRTGW